MTMGTLVCFNCCLAAEQPQPKRRRPRIDRSMIGQPTDFRHTAHVGSRDMNDGNHDQKRLSALQSQMSSKGGYEHVNSVDVRLNVIELPTANHS